MFKPSTWVIAGAAVLATTGVAHAQDRHPAPLAGPNASAAANSAAVPWYQRFTTSSGVTETITGDTENDRLPTPTWTLNQHWGVTLDVQEAQRIERSPEGGRGDQASVGAYYQFTPRLRVGGEVSVEEETPLTQTPSEGEDGPRAGVRIESAFRF